MDSALLDLLIGGGSHGLIVAAIVVLWRENRRLHDKLEAIRLVAASAHALILNQNALVYDATSPKTGAMAQTVSDNKKAPYS